MAAPTVTRCAMEDVQSVGDEYREIVTVVTDGATSNFTLTVGTHTRKIYRIRAVNGAPAVIASNKRTAAITGLILSSTTTLEVIGDSGGGM